MTTRRHPTARQAPTPGASEIELFARVVAAGSFAEAGRQLGLTRAAVSRRVAEIERQVGVALLARTTRAMGLTEAGRRLAQRAQALADAADAARRGLRSDARHELAGTLRITTVPMFGQAVLAPLLARFRERHPQLRVELVQTHRPLDLLRDDLDLAFRLTPQAPPDTVATPLLPYAVRAYAATAQPPLAHPGELAGQPMLALALPGQAHSGTVLLDWQRDGEAALHRVELQPAMQADDMATLLVMACHGGGVVVAPDFAARAAVQAGLLHEALPGWRLPVAYGDRVTALTLARPYASEAARALVRFAAEALGAAEGRAAAADRNQPPAAGSKRSATPLLQ